MTIPVHNLNYAKFSGAFTTVIHIKPYEFFSTFLYSNLSKLHLHFRFSCIINILGPSNCNLVNYWKKQLFFNEKLEKGASDLVRLLPSCSINFQLCNQTNHLTFIQTTMKEKVHPLTHILIQHPIVGNQYRNYTQHLQIASAVNMRFRFFFLCRSSFQQTFHINPLTFQKCYKNINRKQ